MREKEPPIARYQYGAHVRAFHHYGGLRDRKEPLKRDPELDRLLREEYCSLGDFRAKEKANAVKEERH
nr:la-related protein 1a [Quercus suber]